MVSRNIYLQLVFRIILIVLTVIVTTYFFFNKQYIAGSVGVLVLVGLTSALINYVNQTNRKIAYFFDAIKNEDFTLRFPEKLSVKSLEELNHSLNMLNSMIQDIHLKKQAQEQYYQEILRQADIGIFTINAKGHILYANPTVQDLLNYRPLNHVKQLNQVDHELYGLFKDLKPFDNTIFSLGNERGKRELSLKCTPITIEEQQLLLVVAHDINKELDEKETDSWVRIIYSEIQIEEEGNEEEFIESLLKDQFDIRIIGVFSYPLDSSFLGKKYDFSMYEKFKKMNETFDVSLIGEGGELETFIVDGPNFKKKIFLEGTPEMDSENSGIINISKCEVVEK